MCQRVAHEVHAATLPGGVEHLGYGSLDALMGVGHDQLDAAHRSILERDERSPKFNNMSAPRRTWQEYCADFT
jgi:hypothetical protein